MSFAGPHLIVFYEDEVTLTYVSLHLSVHVCLMYVIVGFCSLRGCKMGKSTRFPLLS